MEASSNMSIGNVVRTARKRAGLSLREVQSLTGISLAKLSKVENDKATLRHPEIISLSEAMDVPATFLLSKSKLETKNLGRRSITRAGAAPGFTKAGRTYEVLCGDISNNENLFWKVTITEKAPGTEEAYLSHPGEEFVYVLKGTVAIYTSIYEPLILEEGDSVLFDANVPHAYFATKRKAVVLMSNSRE